LQQASALCTCSGIDKRIQTDKRARKAHAHVHMHMHACMNAYELDLNGAAQPESVSGPA